MTFGDTGGFLAVLSATDDFHERAARALPELLEDGLLVHDYVIVETDALVRRRMGSELARRFLTDLVPLLEVVWVDEALCHQARASYLTSTTRHPSLVDHVSFEVMRRRGLQRAFSFDQDFAAQGFTLVPTASVG